MLQFSFICLPGWKWIWSNLSQIWYSQTPLHGQNSNHTSLGALRIPRPDCCKSNPLVSGHEGLKWWSLLPASMVKQNCSVRLKIHFPITDLSFYCWWLKWLRYFMEIQIPPEHFLLVSFQGGQKLRSFGHNHTESTFIEETKNYVEKWKSVLYQVSSKSYITCNAQWRQAHPRETLSWWRWCRYRQFLPPRLTSDRWMPLAIRILLSKSSP